jgi:alanine dehydrogenase
MARREARVAGFIGTGAQAATQLEGLMVTMPGLRRVLASDLDGQRARTFCEQCRKRHGLEAELGDGPESVVAQADILTTITPSREPIVQDGWVREGTHINAIGADARGKQELEVALLRRSRLVVDSWEQAAHSGEINVGIEQGFLSREDVAGDIGEVVTGRKPGRTSPDEITVFDSTGLAVQDISCAHAVYKKLTASPEQRTRLRTISLFGQTPQS